MALYTYNSVWKFGEIFDAYLFDEIYIRDYQGRYISNIHSTTREKHLIRNTFTFGGRHGRNRMVVRFTTTCAISAYHH
jgi:hypothetical protein